MGVFYDLWTYDHKAGGKAEGFFASIGIAVKGAFDEARIRTFAYDSQDDNGNIRDMHGNLLTTQDVEDAIGANDLGRVGGPRSVIDPRKYKFYKHITGFQVIPKFFEASLLFLYLLMDRLILAPMNYREGTLSFWNPGEAFAIVLRAIVYCTFGLAYRALKLITSPIIEIWNPVVKMWDNLCTKGAWFTGYKPVSSNKATLIVVGLIIAVLALVVASIFTGGILPGLGALATAFGSAIGSAFWAQAIMCVAAVPVVMAVVARVYNDMREAFIDFGSWISTKGKGYDQTVADIAYATSQPNAAAKVSLFIVELDELPKPNSLKEQYGDKKAPVLIKVTNSKNDKGIQYHIYDPMLDGAGKSLGNGRTVQLTQAIIQKYDEMFNRTARDSLLGTLATPDKIDDEVFKDIAHHGVIFATATGAPALTRAGSVDATSSVADGKDEPVPTVSGSADVHTRLVSAADAKRLEQYRPDYHNDTKDSIYLKSSAWFTRVFHLPAMPIKLDNPWVIQNNHSPDVTAKGSPQMGRFKLETHAVHSSGDDAVGGGDLKGEDGLVVGRAFPEDEAKFSEIMHLGTGVGRYRAPMLGSSGE